ncbi:pentatricopeptide repeat-containing protein At5g48730, chloroplastic-like [Triticum dicoccoides]|uniref:pentatricopeptide repeat-containing protein At5g48730, chloroplastic-like n=1 Tax=Triticum dicoccoides TaxID=85692 RepID=UPI00188F131D|nr:pentatricopeptide repeat-containing protein At5g48730, chloroplastic-like [Triticum dicoccoides]
MRHPPPLARAPARAAPRRSLFSSLLVSRSLIQSPLAAQWPPRRWCAPSPCSPRPPPPSARHAPSSLRAGPPPAAAASPHEQQSARGAAGVGKRRQRQEEEKVEADAEDLERQRKEEVNRKIASRKALSIILRREATKAVLDKREPGKGTRRLLPRIVLEALHDHVIVLRWESALKVFELMRDQVFRSVHPPRPSPRSACCVCIQVWNSSVFHCISSISITM